MKDPERFVDLNRINELEKEASELFSKYIEIKSEITKDIFCYQCGDTKPKHGFYPLLSSRGFLCNRCGQTDENYERFFKEPKEIIE